MASLNAVHLIGRCGKDPEQRFTPSGAAVTTVSIACSEKFKNKAGETEERTEWVNLVFWNKLAEIVGEFVQKGKEIYVSGKLQTRKWDDKEGVTRYTTEVVCDKMQMLGGKGEGKPADKSEPRYADDPNYDPDGEDIPF